MVGISMGAVFMGRVIVRLTHYMRVPIVGLLDRDGGLRLLAVETAALSLTVVHGAWLGVLGIAIGPMFPAARS